MPSTVTAPRERPSLTRLARLGDDELVQLARDGEQPALEEIVRRYREPLTRYSARHVGRDYAEDVTQHALTQAVLHLRNDPRPIHLRAWLYRVAHNVAINMRSRRDWSHEELSLEIDGVPQPPDLAAQRGQVRAVVGSLDQLPERQRQALVMRVFEGRDYEQIAESLDTSPNSVRALLSRARSRLRSAAAALAPIPLLTSVGRRLSDLVGAGGHGPALVAGEAVQAKILALAATTVVAAGAAHEAASDAADKVDRPSPAPAATSDPIWNAPAEINALLLTSTSPRPADPPARVVDQPAAKPPTEPLTTPEPPPTPAPPADTTEPVAEPAPEPEPMPEPSPEPEPQSSGGEEPKDGGTDPLPEPEPPVIEAEVSPNP